MLFSSITFLVFFFPVTLVLYYALPSLRFRNCLLLFASLLFYAWGEPKFVLVMIASILFNYGAGLLLTSCKKKLLVLIAAIVVNLGCLFVFKYLGFSIKIIDLFLKALHFKAIEQINLVLPLGISFYTFQSISYLVDVYKNPEFAQRNAMKLGLYIAFFPQLIAGPIVRYHDINTQIDQRTHSVEKVAQGLERFIIGLSKKVLLANAFALVCDKIYAAQMTEYGAYAAWIACFAYALQIYYDFSGYSDMAIGLAKIFGFSLTENFNYPYAASSVTDFWKRWHISLTNFFRDYVYIPLGGNRKGKIRTILNRYIVFFITGLWHGAAFNFILWGLAHGTLMTIERLFLKKSPNSEQSDESAATSQEKLKKCLKLIFSHAYTILAVALLWVLFRNGTGNSVRLLLKMVGLKTQNVVLNEYLHLYIDTRFFILSALGIIFSFPWWHKIPFPKTGAKAGIILSLKYLVLAALLVLCYANLADSSYNPFIYFRF